MIVWENGSSFGSIGGGKIEHIVIGETVEALKMEKSRSFSHSLTPEGILKCNVAAKQKAL